MADFVISIKIQTELLGIEGGGARGGGGGGSSGGGDSGPLFASIRELREEFGKLAAQIRAVSTGLDQIKEASTRVAGGPAAAGTGASAGPVPATAVQELASLTKAASDVGEAAKGAAAATEKQAEAVEREAAAREAAAKATQTEAEIRERAAQSAIQSAQDAAQATQKATKADEQRAKALAALAEARQARGIGERAGGGRLSPDALFQNILEPLLKSEELRNAGRLLKEEIDNLVTIPEGATDEARKVGEEFRKVVRGIFESTRREIEAGGAPSRVVGRAVGKIVSERSAIAERLAPGQAPQVRADIAGRALGAAHISLEVERVASALSKLGKDLEEGAAGIDVPGLINEIEGRILGVAKVLEANAERTFTARGQQEAFAGASQFIGPIRAELDTRRGTPLEPTLRQSAALKEFQQSITDSIRPMEAVSKVIDALVEDGRSLASIEDDLRVFKDLLKDLSFPDRDDFLRFQESTKLLNRVKVDETRGVVGPAGAVSPDAALAQGRFRIDELSQVLASQGRGATGSLSLQLPTDGGGIRKVRVELEALGNTLDSVRVKARDVTDNMFDRTSVRAALQRVATWGAAATIVFKSVEAFRRGLDTVISTEAAVIALSKVMDESARDLEAFSRRATQAALDIATKFGQPLEEVLETLNLFGQQGRGLAESIELASAAALAASVTTLNQPDAASALTAAVNQFGLAFTDAESVIDKFNEVANNAAVTETVLAEALSRAGQAAVTAGVDLDQFNGIVAAISEQTRQTGSEIGTALRFIFARLQTPEAQEGLQAVGVSVRDATGNVRGFIPVLTELASKFDTLTESQKVQVAVSVAETRRFNSFLALLDNFSRFQESAANSANSAGSALREQQKVTQTAAFRIEELRNSLKGLALSFGDSLLDPVKLVVSALTSLTSLLSAIPGPIKTIGAALGAGTLAFVKFSDTITDLLGLTSSLKGVAPALGGSIRAGLTAGVSRQAQRRSDAVGFLNRSDTDTFARTVGDFAGFGAGVTNFSKALTESNQKLVTQGGLVVQNSAAFSKFGSIVRGVGVQSADGLQTTALSIAALNSGFGRLFATIGIFADRFLRAIPLVGRGLDALDAKTVALNSKFLGAVGTLARFAGAGLAIGGLVLLFGKLSDFLNRSGVDAAKALDPEIQKRQEALSLVNKQLAAIRSLSDEQRRVSALGPGTGATELNLQQRDQVLRRSFTSPSLARQRLAGREVEAQQQVGLAAPQFINSIDSLGRVTLKGAAAFEALAESVANTEKNLLALAQVRVVEELSKELGPETGLARFLGGATRTIVPDFIAELRDLGRTEQDELNKAIEELNTARGERGAENIFGFEAPLQFGLQDSRQELLQAARDFNVDISIFDEDAAKEIREASDRLEAQTDEVRSIIDRIDRTIAKLPEDPGDRALRRLFSTTSNFRNFLSARVQDVSLATGRQIDQRGVAEQLFLRTSGAVRKQNAAGLIGFDADETIERFREAGIDRKAIDFSKDISQQIQSFAGGELILFPNAKALPDGFPRQALVEVTSTGERVLKTVGDSLDPQTLDLRDVFQQAADTGVREGFVINPNDFRAEIDRSLLEVNRVITGAARGILIEKDLDLGVNFSFDVSAQQRVAFRDEDLFGNIIKAEDKLNDAIKEFGKSADDNTDAVANAITPEKLASIGKLAEELDRLKTITKVETVIEEVVKSFEKASADIRNSGIRDAIAAQFPTALGAQAGIFPQSFEEPKTEGQLTAEEALNKLAPEATQLTNTFVRGQKALQDFVAGLEIAERDAATIVSDFEATRELGGIRDPNLISAFQDDLTRRLGRGEGQADAQLLSFANLQLTEQQKANIILQRIADNTSENVAELGRQLSLAADSFSSAGESEQKIFLERLRALDPEKFSGFAQKDRENIFSKLTGQELPAALSEAITSGRAKQSSLNIFSRGLGIAAQAREEARAGSGTADQRQVENIAKEIAKNNDIQESLTRTLLATVKERRLQSGQESGQIQLLENDISNIVDQVISTVENSDAPGADDLADLLKENRDQVASLVEQNIRFVSKLPDAFVPPVVEISRLEQPRDRFDDLKARSQALKESIALQKQFDDSIRDTVTAFRQVGTSITGLKQDLASSFRELLSNIGIDRELREFTTPLTGLLKGIEIPQIDLGVFDRSELSSRQLTSLESPGLATGLTEASRVSDGFVVALRKVSETEQFVQARLEEFSRNRNARGIDLASTALKDLGRFSTLLAGQANNARDTLRRFGESFQRVEIVNQLRIDVEKLFESFRKQQALQFDRTSIETGLGRGPFAALRPTFEQFERGQAGFLTKFERAVADIDFRQRSGELGIQEASRERRRAEFERDEEIIGFAQERENRQLESQTSTAEQIRSRLLDFVSIGGPGANVAQGLFDDLTRELESAGDVIQSNFGPQTIRDPRTGRDVNIPASDVLQFKGVPGLQQAVQTVQQLSQQIRAQQAQENADLITKPLVEIQTKSLEKLDEIVRTLKEQSGVAGAENKLEAIQAFRSEVLPGLQNLQQAFSKGEGGTRQTQQILSQAVESLRSVGDRFGPDAVQDILRLPIANTQTGEDGKPIPTTVRTALANAGLLDQSGVSSEIVGKLLSEFTSPLAKISDSVDLLDTQAIQPLQLKFNSLNEAVGSVILVFNRLSELASQQNRGTSAQPTESVPAKQEGFASGGLIRGPGGPREDRVPIRASAGEFVLNAKTVRSIGVSTLNALNNSGGAIGPDGSIGFTPSIGMQDGGAVITEILKLEERRNALAAKGVLSASEQAELFKIDQEVSSLHSLRRQRQDELSRKRAQGFRLSDIGEESTGGAVIPNSVLAQENAEVNKLLRKETDRRSDVSRRLGSLSGFAPGQVYVGLSEDGERLSFTNIPRGGFTDAASLSGVPVDDPKKFKSEISKREKVKQRVEVAREAAKARVRAQQEQFLKLASEEAEENAIIKQRNDFQTAFSKAQADLYKRTTEFNSNVSGRVNQFVSDYGTANSILTQSSGYVATTDERRQIAKDIKDNADQLEILLAPLRDTGVFPFLVNPPPGFEDSNTGISFRGSSAGAVSVSRDPFTGRFSANSFGFSLLSSPDIEQIYSQFVKDGNIGNLLEAAKAVKASSNSAQITDEILSRGTNLAVDQIASGAAYLDENGFPILSKAATFGAGALKTASTGTRFVSGVVGAPIETGGKILSTGKNAVLSPLETRQKAEDALYGYFSELDARGEKRKLLNEQLSKTSSSDQRLALKTELVKLNTQNVEDALNLALLAEGLPGLVKGGAAAVPKIVSGGTKLANVAKTTLKSVPSALKELPTGLRSRGLTLLQGVGSAKNKIVGGVGAADPISFAKNLGSKLGIGGEEFKIIRNSLEPEVKPPPKTRLGKIGRLASKVALPGIAGGLVGALTPFGFPGGAAAFGAALLPKAVRNIIGRFNARAAARVPLQLDRSANPRLSLFKGALDDIPGRFSYGPGQLKSLQELVRPGSSTPRSAKLDSRFFSQREVQLSFDQLNAVNRFKSGLAEKSRAFAISSAADDLEKALQQRTGFSGGYEAVRTAGGGNIDKFLENFHKLKTSGTVESLRELDDMVRSVENEVIKSNVGIEKYISDKLGTKEFNVTQNDKLFPNFNPGRYISRGGRIERLPDLPLSRTLTGKELQNVDLERFATGGSISGPGGPKGDRIPILASNGEFVLNSTAVARLGLPLLNALNGGSSLKSLPKFQDGGLVGTERVGQGASLHVSVDTNAISQAITQAITEAVQSVTINISGDDAATVINTAISSAFSNLTLPELQVNTTNVSVDLDIPAGGIPIDASSLSGLNLGNAVGADIRNRLEAVEGSLTSVREDTNVILDTIDSADLEALGTLAQEFQSVKEETASLETALTSLENNLSSQEQRVLDQVEFRLNQEFSNDTTEVSINARLDRELVGVRADLAQVQSQVQEAIRSANQALSKSLARI